MATTFMNLTLPTVSVTLGPEWANEINDSFETVDSHDHTDGKGKAITPAALDLNDSVDFQSHKAFSLYSSQYITQGSTLTGASNASSVYVAGSGDLYFTNSSGVPVQITSGGAVVSTPTSLQTIQYDAFNTDITIGAGDSTVFVAMDTSSARTVTLPLASAVPTGRIYILKDATGQSEANVLTLTASGSDTIDGAASQTIQSNYAAIFVVGNGVNKWSIL